MRRPSLPDCSSMSWSWRRSRARSISPPRAVDLAAPRELTDAELGRGVQAGERRLQLVRGDRKEVLADAQGLLSALAGRPEPGGERVDDASHHQVASQTHPADGIEGEGVGGQQEDEPRP